MAKEKPVSKPAGKSASGQNWLATDKGIYTLASAAALLLFIVRAGDTSGTLSTVPRILWWMIGLAFIPGTLRGAFTRKHLVPALAGAAVLSLLSLSLQHVLITDTVMYLYTQDALTMIHSGLLRRCLVFASGFALIKEAFGAFDAILRQRRSCLEFAIKKPGTSTPRQVMLAVSLLTFLCLCGLWLTKYFPSGTSPDTWNQWYQIHGDIPFTDLHTPLHTMLMGLLLKVWDSYVIVILFQITCIAVITGLLYAALFRRGIGLAVLMLGCVAFSNAGWCHIYMYPWKDTLYAVLTASVLYMMIWANDHEGRLPLWRAALTGLLLALTGLMRYNGLVCLVAAGIYFVVLLLKRRLLRQAAALVLTAAVSVAGVNALAYDGLGYKRLPNGFSMQVLGAGIAAAVNENGNVTQEQLQKIDEILGLDWIRSHYAPWQATKLIWTRETNDPEGYFNQHDTYPLNNFFVKGLGEHQGEVIRLYLSMLPGNFWLFLREAIYGTWLIWGNYGAFSSASLLVLLALALIYALRRGARKRHVYAALIPLTANIASIAVSTITNETRYMLPTFLLFVPVTLYFLSGTALPEAEKASGTSVSDATKTTV